MTSHHLKWGPFPPNEVRRIAQQFREGMEGKRERTGGEIIKKLFLPSWSHRLRPKKLHASVVVPAAHVRVPNQRPLAPSVTSVTSVANDKGDNEMIL